MKERYLDHKFSRASLKLIAIIDDICKEYTRQGYVLTVRQLYYQLVSRNIIENNVKSYNNAAALVNTARLAGLLDWDAIEDRTRAFKHRPHWRDGKHFMNSVAPQFYADMWEGQQNRVFCIIEKEALAGVLQGVCQDYDVPLLAARGYPSVSVLREFAEEHILVHSGAQDITILHLGDHDPSGIDMTRDLVDRLSLLCRGYYHFDLTRIALNMEQVEENNCPPNPAKLTDSRSTGYCEQFGHESWELDALSPSYLVDLVTEKIEEVINHNEWEARQQEIQDTRTKLIDLAEQF